MSPDIKIMKMTETKLVPNINIFKSVLKQVSKWKKKKKPPKKGLWTTLNVNGIWKYLKISHPLS